MVNSGPATDSLSIHLKQIAELSRTTCGSEDDLINKIVLPFFQVLGYGPGSYELKFPVQGYRPDRPGRKPEADCVFFSQLPHNPTSSLLVAEVKRDDPQFPEQQARFYSTNLFVPFYVAWSGLAFEVWQVQNFRPPSLIGRYRLDQMDRSTFSELRELLAPDRITQFCTKNEVKKFDLDDRRKAIEARYLDRLAADLRSFKALDLPQIRDLDTHYVELRLQELDVIPSRSVEEEIIIGKHPEVIESKSSSERTFSVFDLLTSTSAVAIVGDPGAGKTTLLRHLCLDNAYADSRLLPIFISIRDLVSANETLVQSALRQIGCYGEFDNPDYLYEAALAEGRILFCVDGIDELGVDEPRDARASVVRFSGDLSSILHRHPGNKIVITARRESWTVCRPLLPQSLREFTVLPFTPRGVRVFVSKWFAESPDDADNVIDALRARGWPSHARNPLLLTLTCACVPIQGEIPKRTSDLYSRFFQFILEQWPVTRISDRPPLRTLDPDAILRLLGEVALGMHIRRRAASSRSDITNLLGANVSSLEEPIPKPRDLFLELTKQHGMLKSWSIDQYYAFPHLSFQSYFTARALRSHSEGHSVIFEHRHDPLWREALILYAEMGDITPLARNLLDTEDNILQSELFLLAECWAAGGEIGDRGLSKLTIDRLTDLVKGENAYLKDKATSLLGRIAHPEARTAITNMIRDANGGFTEGPATRFAVSALGENVLPDVIAELVRTGNNENLLVNFSSLRRRVAVEELVALILRTDFPLDKDAGVRHLRRRAARLMAQVGQEIAMEPLIHLLSASVLTDFEKRGCVSALATIDDPSVPRTLLEIMAGEFPMDCRIEAAGNLAPEPDARRFLLRIIADDDEDYFDRRDAAGELGSFRLSDDDLSFFHPLIFDPAPHFVGGPKVAVSTVGKVGTRASRGLLEEASAFWAKSSYSEASKVRAAILQALALSLEDKQADLRQILEAPPGHWINWELPKVALEYVRREPEKANELFIEALRSYTEKAIYAGTVANAVFSILPQIRLTDGLIEAAIELSKRLPQSEFAWNCLGQVWQRHDLSITQRSLFRIDGLPASDEPVA